MSAAGGRKFRQHRRAMAIDEFVDVFYLDHPDKMAQQRRLVEIPLQSPIL